MAVWSAGSDETGWLSGLLVGIRLGDCLVCWLGETGWLSGVLVGMRLGGCLVCWLG